MEIGKMSTLINLSSGQVGSYQTVERSVVLKHVRAAKRIRYPEDNGVANAA